MWGRERAEGGNDSDDRNQAPSSAPLTSQQEQSQAEADGQKSPAIRFAELQQQFPNATQAQLHQLEQIAHDFDPRQGLSLHSFAQGQIGFPSKVPLTNWNSQPLSVDNNIQMPYLNETMKVKTVTPEEMLKMRFESSQNARKMTQEEAHKQMRENGSVPRPNPWYRGEKKEDGSSSQNG